MFIICKNCHSSYNGNFCPNCGQSKKTHKITPKFVLHDLQYGLLHFNRGFLYTTKQLFTRPGHTIREYIQGKRVQHYRPISLLIILSTLYVFLLHYFDLGLISPVDNDADTVPSTSEVTNWMREHYAISELMLLPIFSFFTYLLFFRQGHNYFEYFVINAFLGCQRLLLKLAMFPLVVLLPSWNSLPKFISLLELLLLIWTFLQLYRNKNFLLVIFKILTAVLLLFLFVGIIIYIFELN